MNNSHRFYVGLIVAALVVSFSCGEVCLGEGESVAADRRVSDWLRWEQLPTFPDPAGVAGAFVGTSDRGLLVAGGMNSRSSPSGVEQRHFGDTIYTLVPNGAGYRWLLAGRLSSPVAEGAAVSSSEGVVCVGGRNEDGCSSDVFLIRLTADGRQVDIQNLPSLPRALRFPAAAILDSIVYIAGGVDDNGAVGSNFWSLDLDNPIAWRKNESWAGKSRYGAALVAQTNGERNSLFLFGGKSTDALLTDAHRYDSRTKEWHVLGELPRPAFLAPAAALGPSHVAVVGGANVHDADRLDDGGHSGDFSNETLLYNTITDRWSSTTPAPRSVAATSAVNFAGGLVMVGGEVKSGVSTPSTIRASMPLAARHLTALDFLTIASYLLLIVGVGFYCAGRGKTSSDYFLAGQRIPWWAAGISIMATQISPIGFMAVPSKSFATNWVYFTGVVTWLIIVPIVVTCFIPFFRQLHVRSAYQYLEHRFGRGACVYAAAIFSLAQLVRMAVIVYLPALAFASLTNLNLEACVVTMGAIATVYTVLGGMRAVVWTDVIQAILLIGGALLVLIWVAFHANGGPLTGLQTAYENNKLRAAQLDWDISGSVLWVVLVGTAFSRLAELTSDQAVVQRYQSTPTQRDASRALWLNAALSVPWALLVFSLGTAIFVFYHDHPQVLSPAIASDSILAFFVAQQLPPGIRGLIIAAIFAEAISSLVTSMHSTATVWANDFYAHWFPRSPDGDLLRVARLLVAFLGVFAIGTAIWMSMAPIVSMWDLFIGITGPLAGNLCGLFLLGIFTSRANGAGALLGAIGSGLVTWAVSQFTSIHFLLYAPLGVLSCVLLGYVGSCFFPRPTRIAGLTYSTSRATLGASN